MINCMFNCKKVTRLVSESLDRKLPLYQRAGIEIHLLMCKLCRRYKQQLTVLRGSIRTWLSNGEDIDFSISLPPETRKRIQRFLHNKLDKHA